MIIDLLKERQEIEQLAEIKSVGFKITEGEQDEFTRLILQDVDGKTYEFPLCHYMMAAPEDEWLRYARAVVVNMALEKAFGKDWYQMQDVQVASDDVSDMIKAINAARKLKKFEQIGCVNEEKARIYDHVCPVFII